MNTTSFTLEFVKVSNLNLNRQFWFFGPNLLKKGFPSLKEMKWILHIRKKQFWISVTNLSKKAISGQKKEKRTSPLESAYSN